MTILQAYRRTKTHVVTLLGLTLRFEPNDKGDVVCDVEDGAAVERLLDIPTGFRLYGEAPESPVSPLPYVLVGAAGSFDLRPLSDADLHAFAQVNGVTVHHNAKGNTIRDRIVGHFKREA